MDLPPAAKVKFKSLSPLRIDEATLTIGHNRKDAAPAGHAVYVNTTEEGKIIIIRSLYDPDEDAKLGQFALVYAGNYYTLDDCRYAI